MQFMRFSNVAHLPFTPTLTPIYDTTHNLQMYITKPPNAVNLPCIIQVHGGGWIEGLNTDFGARMANTGLCVTFSVQYRLGPAGVYPASELDVSRAIAWVKTHAASYGANPSRIGMLGSSAGGSLTAINQAAVSAIVTWSGVLDYPPLGSNAEPSSTTLKSYIGGHVAASWAANPGLWASASPVAKEPLPGWTPWLAFNGAQGELVPPAQLTDVTNADPAAVTILMPEAVHAIHYQNDIVPGDTRTVWRYSLDWLLAHI